MNDARPNFQAFFSYAHHDGRTDPQLITHFTNRLEERVNSRIINTEFSIWIDRERLKTGYKWNEHILRNVSQSSLLIVLLTPKWIESAYCRRELDTFLEVEGRHDTGQYIIPILSRSVEDQIDDMNEDQRKAYSELADRQYAKVFAADFLAADDKQRLLIVENIADDIEGLLKRLRRSSTAGAKHEGARKREKRIEFDARAHNFETTEFFTEAEVVIEPKRESNRRALLAYVSFLPRMYIQYGNTRIEFGIQRAFLTVSSSTDGTIHRHQNWPTGPNESKPYYLNSKMEPNALTVCIDPIAGKATLQELPLPPAPGENRLSNIGSASPEVHAQDITANLSVSLSAEGLFIFGEAAARPSSGLLKKINAVARVAALKDHIIMNNHMIARIPVKDKE